LPTISAHAVKPIAHVSVAFWKKQRRDFSSFKPSKSVHIHIISFSVQIYTPLYWYVV